MNVDFIFDFASPNSYLVQQVLPRIADRTGAQINYIPCLLGGVFKATGNQPPWQAFANVPSKVAYEELEFKRFIMKHRLVNFKMNEHFPINTISLMRGAVAAQLESEEAFNKYLNTMFSAMWEQGRDMNSPDEVAAVLAESGYSPQDFINSIQDDAVKEKLRSNTDAVIARGVFGIPTFFVGDEMFFGKERLEQLEAEILRQQS